ncbi:MAG: hypothetical protein AB1599_04695 [Planctomycetota bacterium]
MRRTNLLVLLLVALVWSALSTVGCDKIKEAFLSAAAKEPVTITSDDGSAQITAPGNWKKRTDLHDDAMLQAADIVGENYIVVLPDSKADLEDGMNINGHSDITRSSIMENIKDCKQTAGPVMLTINGRPAVQYELRGVVSGVKIVYLHTTTDGNDKFYQILAWTMPSSYQKNKPVLESVVNSFKETGTK